MNYDSLLALALAVATALALVVSGFIFGARAARKRAHAELVEIRARSELLLKENEQLTAHAREAEGKSETNLRVLLDMQSQRDQWQKLYMDQGAAHGNAQALMMETIERLFRTLQTHGIKCTLSPILQQVRSEFLEKHELPIAKLREAQEQVSKPAPSET